MDRQPLDGVAARRLPAKLVNFFSGAMQYSGYCSILEKKN